MELFNKRLLASQLRDTDGPTTERLQEILRIIGNWQKAFKDSNLAKTRETSTQGRFLHDFFGLILGYSTQTDGDNEWTLEQHPVIETNAKIPDGALGFFSPLQRSIKAVIELKDALTPLDKKQARESKLTPIEQAFGYAAVTNQCH